MRRVAVGLVLLLATACGSRGGASSVDGESAARPVGVAVSRGGQELIGTAAPPFAEDLRWIHGEPTDLEALRGKVVLVRFWTDTCPFCQASAPALSQLHEAYGDQGLVVIGMHHPKPRGSEAELEGIRARAAELGMEFSIASDEHWDTLERWWLDAGEGRRKATSVSFLIDAQGTIRWIHPGPEFHPDGPADHEQCREDYADAVATIEALLRERAEKS